jgi:hypothetical protein
MSLPCRVSRIFSEQTALRNMDCLFCSGQGETCLFDPETGHELQPCEACQGSGYNLPGLIIHGLLSPPEGGFGPQKLQDILRQRNAIRPLSSPISVSPSQLPPVPAYTEPPITGQVLAKAASTMQRIS